MVDTCGAKTRAGGVCKAPAMSNGRCRVHGGASTGPKTPNCAGNALKHGIYSEFLTDDENELAETIELGRVDDELKLCRIRLRRALEAEYAAQEELEIDEEIYREGGGDNVAAHEKKLKKRDYSTAIDKILGRIESLERTRRDLLKKDDGDQPDDGDITRDDTTIAPDEPVPEKPIL